MIKTIQQNKKLYLTTIVSLILIAISLVSSSMFTILALVLSAISIILMTPSNAFVLLIALMPFANVFKLTAGSMSFFTILEMLAVIVFFFKMSKMRGGSFMCVVILFVYMMLFSFNDLQIFTIIKAVVGLLLIYFATIHIKNTDIKNMAYLLSISVGVMLILCVIPSYSEKVQPFFEDINYYIDSSGSVSDTVRYSGFLGDPNYCAVMIVVTLSLLCVLYYYKQIGVEFWLFAAILAPLGFLTYSKSYFLCIAMLAVFLILFVLFPKHKGWAAFSLFGVAVLFYLTLSGKIEVFNMIINRLKMGDLTSGRDTLNKNYLTYIFNNFEVLFFGEGISVERFSGVSNNVHNIYIELLFKLGIVGSIIYIVTLFFMFKRTTNEQCVKRHFIDYVPALFIIVMFGFLAGVLDYTLPFYLIIAYVAFNYNPISSHENLIKR